MKALRLFEKRVIWKTYYHTKEEEKWRKRI